MALKYLSISNLSTVWTKIKAYLSSNYQPKGSYASSDHNHNSAYLGISAKAESAKSADSVAWGGVSGRPTAVSQFSNDSGYITTDGAAYPRRVGGVTMNFNWYDKGGQPTWLWGGEDGTNMYVYNPANFSVNYANSAGRAEYLGDIGSTDRNAASGTGWYSVGFSYNYDEGHNELAINNYWGIRLNCRDSEHASINGHIIINSGNIGSQSVNYANSAGSAPANGGNSDTLDGCHEYQFLRYREATSSSGEGSLWSQIGVKEYLNALPDGLSNTYPWGEVISIPSANSRFEIYCSHTSSAGGGLHYRSGWESDKKEWRYFIDSANIGSQSVYYATYASRSMNNGSFYISGYQIYVG